VAPSLYTHRHTGCGKSTVDDKDMSGNEAGITGTEVDNGTGCLFRAGIAAQRRVFNAVERFHHCLKKMTGLPIPPEWTIQSHRPTRAITVRIIVSTLGRLQIIFLSAPRVRQAHSGSGTAVVPIGFSVKILLVHGWFVELFHSSRSGRAIEL